MMNPAHLIGALLALFCATVLVGAIVIVWFDRATETDDPDESVTAADIPWRAGDEGCGYLTAGEYEMVTDGE